MTVVLVCKVITFGLGLDSWLGIFIVVLLVHLQQSPASMQVCVLGRTPLPSRELLVTGPWMVHTHGPFPLSSAFLLLKLGFPVGWWIRACCPPSPAPATVVGSFTLCEFYLQSINKKSYYHQGFVHLIIYLVCHKPFQAGGRAVPPARPPPPILVSELWTEVQTKSSLLSQQ